MPASDRSGATAVAWGGAALFAASLAWFAYCYLVRFDALRARLAAPAAIAADAALFTLFALHHSLLARPAAKAHVRRHVPAPLERSCYTWVASALFLLVCAAWQAVPGTAWRLPDGWRIAGYGVQLVGLALTIRGSARLDVLDLAGVRQVQRAQSGLPDSHVPLETTGVYGLVRHPLYFAWALVVFAAPDMTATRLTFAVTSTAYLAAAIPFEERTLLRTFGPAYAAYKRRVRWRMLPGIY
jgi:protein-S-isoprenylcysteine O-methyltransferase Ste14